MHLPFSAAIPARLTGLGLLLLGGCAFVESSLESASESASGAIESLARPFESSSNSSGGESNREEQTSYLRDVRAYTLAYLREPSDAGDFARGLSRVARAHGINDWESDRVTFTTIDAASRDPRVEPAARARLHRELAGFTHGG